MPRKIFASESAESDVLSWAEEILKKMDMKYILYLRRK